MWSNDFTHTVTGFRLSSKCTSCVKQSCSLVNLAKMYYTVNIDLKEFSLTTYHTNNWTKHYGISVLHDKRVLGIINKMLKTEVVGEGISTKGVLLVGFYHRYYQILFSINWIGGCQLNGKTCLLRINDMFIRKRRILKVDISLDMLMTLK